MICALSPASDNFDESLSTLRYADQAKKIKNKPVVNESETDKLIKSLKEENERLRKLLAEKEAQIGQAPSQQKLPADQPKQPDQPQEQQKDAPKDQPPAQ